MIYLGQQTAAARIHWGDIPTAASTVVSFAALIAAIVAAKVARSILRVELDRDKARDAAKERLQAEKIAAWPCLVPASPTNSKSKLTWGTAMRNTSELPVYQVLFVSNPISGDVGVHKAAFELVPPGDWVLIGTTLWARSDLPKIAGGLPIPDRNFGMSLRFTDAAGRHWSRDSHGMLSRAGD